MKKQNKKMCPFCKSTNVAEILYGLPGFDEQLEKDLASGKIVLGGCVISDDSLRYHCNLCEKEWENLNTSNNTY